MGHIKRHHLREAKCIVPNKPLVSAADEIFSSILERTVCNDVESRNLTALLGTLLPKLISGELRMKEASRLMEEAI